MLQILVMLKGETPDKIVVFGGGDERYDIPIAEIQQVGANILIGLKIYNIVTKFAFVQ